MTYGAYNTESKNKQKELFMSKDTEIGNTGNVVRITDGNYTGARDVSVLCSKCCCSFKKCRMHIQMGKVIKIIIAHPESDKEIYTLFDDAGYPFLYTIPALDVRTNTNSAFSFDEVISGIKKTAKNCRQKKITDAQQNTI